jgi:NADPH:quinone reductase-like Zn-dependent oxidoreductase
MADASKDAPAAASEVKTAEPAKAPLATPEKKPADVVKVKKKEPGPDSCTGIVYAHANKTTGMVIKKDVRVKAPGKRELLIKVLAASINPVDYKLNTMPVVGLFQEGKTVGLDFCGEVLKIGYKVQNFKVGDHVYGFANGSLAEYCIAEEAKVALKPAKVRPHAVHLANHCGGPTPLPTALHSHPLRSQMDFKDAASLPVVAVTTYQARRRISHNPPQPTRRRPPGRLQGLSR